MAQIFNSASVSVIKTITFSSTRTFSQKWENTDSFMHSVQLSVSAGF